MTLPIACAQIASAPFDPASNFDKAEHFIRRAARQGARLILLPEFLTTNCAYDYRLHDYAEPLDGPTTTWLRRQSRVNGCWLGAGFIEAAERGVYDTFLLAGPAGEFYSYRKQYPAFFELLFFHCGRSWGVFDTPLGRIGTLLCWDMVQARVARCLAGRVDLLLISSAWPDVSQGNIPLFGVRGWLSRQPKEKPPLLAAQMGVPVVYCNMTGPFLTGVPYLGLTYRSEYPGNSSINDAGGRTVGSLRREEDFILGEVQVATRKQRRAAA